MSACNSTELNPSPEAVGRSAGLKITLIELNLKIHYRVDKIPPLDPILSQLNPTHNLTSYFFKLKNRAL
jgi:hypothetical protein